MKPLNLAVLLFCLIAYGHSRPSDSDEHDEILREAKKDTKHFQHDSVSELHQTETLTTENILGRLKSIAHLRMAETKKPALDSVTREELEALRDLLDKNLQKYQNYNEYSMRKRPADPYIGQIIQNLNGEPQSTGGGNNNMQPHHQQHHHHNNNNNNDDDDDSEQPSQHRQMPIRRKIIRHTVFAMPMQGGSQVVPNRMYNGGDASSRIDWTSPWADYFPILIKDPLQTMMNSFSEIIEYGPAADICRHATGDEGTAVREDANNRPDGGGSSRTSRRTAGGGTASTVGPETRRRSRRRRVAPRSEDEKGLLNNVRPFKQTTTTAAAPSKGFPWAPDKQAAEHNGDTGPQIKRLVVRRGGVAIAGPGGIATAGSGGTAIVGPGGSAYSTKHTAAGATADAPLPATDISMAGNGPQVVQAPPIGYYAPYPPPNNGFARSMNAGAGGTAVLSADGVAYTFPTPSRGLTTSRRRRSESGGREISLPVGAKLIATGPIVYYNPEPSVRKMSRKAKKSAKPAAGKLDDHLF